MNLPAKIANEEVAKASKDILEEFDKEKDPSKKADLIGQLIKMLNKAIRKADRLCREF